MPDIQAGDQEMTQDEALQLKAKKYANSGNVSGFVRLDELGEPHDESVYNHLGRS